MTTQLRPLSEVRTEAVREYYSDRTSYTRNQISLPLLTILTTDRDTAYTLLREEVELLRAKNNLNREDFGYLEYQDLVDAHNKAIDHTLGLLDHIYGKTDALTK